MSTALRIAPLVATSAEYCRWKLSRIGLTVDDAVREELADYRDGLDGALDSGQGVEAYALEQPDVSIWEGERIMAEQCLQLGVVGFCLVFVIVGAGQDTIVVADSGNNRVALWPLALELRK